MDIVKGLPEEGRERPSLLRRWSSLPNVAPMPCSRGIIGDLVWNTFPALRIKIREIVCDEVARAAGAGEVEIIYYDSEEPASDQLFMPDDVDYIVHVLAPAVFGALINESASVDIIERFCRFIRLAVTYDGPGRDRVLQVVEDHILDSLTVRSVIRLIASNDPELVRYIRDQLGIWER